MVHKARNNSLPFWNKKRHDSDHLVIAFEAYRQLSSVSIMPMTVENNPYDRSLMLFMDYRDYMKQKVQSLDTEYPTFLYVMPMSPSRVFFEETCLASRDAMPFDLLKKKLMSRLETMDNVLASAPVGLLGLLLLFQNYSASIMLLWIGGTVSVGFMDWKNYSASVNCYGLENYSAYVNCFSASVNFMSIPPKKIGFFKQHLDFRLHFILKCQTQIDLNRVSGTSMNTITLKTVEEELNSMQNFHVLKQKEVKTNGITGRSNG
ncbi:hypothetical protein GIB67_008797 [Kingdonia uniflora]|uniref:Uncharacterized protein n=1 Tax=Kingdonia uniflora TaxID=39325 RepID=A0A7J7MI31_9MAGN|nr:hypothetical protein GIB67_008797 [Kingdonia uniflora]